MISALLSSRSYTISICLLYAATCRAVFWYLL